MNKINELQSLMTRSQQDSRNLVSKWLKTDSDYKPYLPNDEQVDEGADLSLLYNKYKNEGSNKSADKLSGMISSSRYHDKKKQHGIPECDLEENLKLGNSTKREAPTDFVSEYLQKKSKQRKRRKKSKAKHQDATERDPTESSN